MIKKIGWRRLRLATQALFWVLFLLPLAGFPWFTGTYIGSQFLGFRLTDPFGSVQLLVASGAMMAAGAALGLLLVTLVYLVLGRAFCSWVCPLGSLLEALDWVAERLLPPKRRARRAAWPRWSRWAFALAILLLAALSGQTLFEWVSPQATLMRSLVFGLGLQLLIVVVVVLFDLVVLRRGWCRSACPAGAFYSILGRFSILRVGHDREVCNKCAECIQACPMNGKETLLETVAGRGPAEADPWICTNCGSCIDACPNGGLSFTPAWAVKRAEKPSRLAGYDRRQAIGLLGGAAVVAGLSVARPLLAAPEERSLLRPPGALPEAAFLGLCIRCGQCEQACPRDAIHIGKLEQGLSMGTPYITPRTVACDLCGDAEPACVAQCPTGALTLDPGSPVRMGVAVIETERCLAHHGDVCRSCFNACPLRGEALYLEGALRPAVNPDICTGCGLCVEHCIIEPTVITVLPSNEHA